MQKNDSEFDEIVIKNLKYDSSMASLTVKKDYSIRNNSTIIHRSHAENSES